MEVGRAQWNPSGRAPFEIIFTTTGTDLMRILAVLATCAALAAGPALADPATNVDQPSRTVPQTGQMSGGPIDQIPGDGGAGGPVLTTGTVVVPAGEPMLVGPGIGAVDSAKGSNAGQINKPAANYGGTAGGPGY